MVTLDRATIVRRLTDKIVQLFVENGLESACLLSSQLLLDGITLVFGAQPDCVLREGYFAIVDDRIGGRHYWAEIDGVNIDLSQLILKGRRRRTPQTILVHHLPASTERTDLETEDERSTVAQLEAMYAAIQQHGSGVLWQSAPPRVAQIRRQFLLYVRTLR